MVEVAISWCRVFEGPKAAIIERLVVDVEGFIQVLNKLVDGEGSIVGLSNRNMGMSVHCKFSSDLFAYLNDGIQDLGLGITEYINIIPSGYSSQIFEIKRGHILAPWQQGPQPN